MISDSSQILDHMELFVGKSASVVLIRKGLHGFSHKIRTNLKFQNFFSDTRLGILLWCDLYLSFIFIALLISKVLTEPDLLLESMNNQPGNHAYL